MKKISEEDRLRLMKCWKPLDTFLDILREIIPKYTSIYRIKHLYTKMGITDGWLYTMCNRYDEQFKKEDDYRCIDYINMLLRSNRDEEKEDLMIHWLGPNATPQERQKAFVYLSDKEENDLLHNNKKETKIEDIEVKMPSFDFEDEGVDV